MKKWMIVVAQLAITSAHPPLTPSEAVTVLTGRPPTNQTVVYLTGLANWKPSLAPYRIDGRVSNGSDPRNGPYGSLGDYPAQAPLNCCRSYRTSLTTGLQWQNGKLVR